MSLFLTNCKNSKSEQKSVFPSVVENISLSTPKFDGSNAENFDKSYEKILENLQPDEQEKLKEAVGMLLIFGTGNLEDDKELKWEKLRKQIDGMNAKEVLKFVEEKAQNDYK